MALPCQPGKRHPWDRVTLAQCQRIRQWHASRPSAHPLERRTWEAVLTLWIMGWVGWLPAFESGTPWAYPLCVMGIFSPRIYVYWRAKAHLSHRMRCDWLDMLD